GQKRDQADRRHPAAFAAQAPGRAQHHHRAHRRGQGTGGTRRLRPRLWGATAASDNPEGDRATAGDVSAAGRVPRQRPHPRGRSKRRTDLRARPSGCGADGSGRVIQWTATRTEVQTAWRPPADVYETPTRVSVTIELAGIEPAEVAVLFFDQAIVVEGRRRLPALDETR